MVFNETELYSAESKGDATYPLTLLQTCPPVGRPWARPRMCTTDQHWWEWNPFLGLPESKVVGIPWDLCVTGAVQGSFSQSNHYRQFHILFANSCATCTNKELPSHSHNFSRILSRTTWNFIHVAQINRLLVRQNYNHTNRKHIRLHPKQMCCKMCYQRVHFHSNSTMFQWEHDN